MPGWSILIHYRSSKKISPCDCAISAGFCFIEQMRTTYCQHRQVQNFNQAAGIAETPFHEQDQHALIIQMLPVLRSTLSGYRLSGDIYDECYGEGSVAVIKAVRNFNPDRGYSISSYVSWFIHGAIKETLRKKYLISIPKNRWYASRREIQPSGDTKTAVQLPTTVPFNNFQNIDEVASSDQRLDTPETFAERSHLQVIISKGLGLLANFEKRVICARFGLGTEILSTRKIAQQLHTNRSAVLKAEESARRVLRIFFIEKGLRSFIG